MIWLNTALFFMAYSLVLVAGFIAHILTFYCT